ncbi:MAG TPA: FHA domain-containing protein, partial [Acidobacteriota bacterium]|nr:FHA domain-containing protein [Acidobacteriota bacterium]
MRLALIAPLRPDHPVWHLETTPVRIGRTSQNAVRIDDRSVSREHAEIVLRDGRVLISDLRSHNGTWLNGSRLRRPAEIHEGDRIQVGRVELRVVPDPADRTAGGDSDSALSTLTMEATSLTFGGRLGSDERSSEILHRLQTFGRVLAKHQTLHGTIESLLCAVEDALPAKRVSFLMRRDEGSEPGVVAARPRIPCLASPPVVTVDDLCGILERRMPMLLPRAGSTAAQGPRPHAPREAHHALAVPLAHQGRAIGLLYAEHRGLQEGYRKEDLEIATLFANLATTRIVSERMTDAGATKAGFEHEIVLAAQIQRWLLPSAEPKIAGYDIHALLEPCEAVGGDFYDFHTDAN